MLATAVPEMLRVIKEDSERPVVTAAMESLTEMLKEIKLPVLEAPGGDTVTNIMKVIKDVMLQKVTVDNLFI